MNEAAEKNSKFLEAINRAALKNCQSLEEEIQRQTRIEMQKAEDKIHTECHQKMEKETQKRKAATVGKLAGYSNEKREALSKRRQEMEAAVFEKVCQQIDAYRSTEAYRQSLLDSARAMQPLFQGAKDLVLLVAKADLPMASQLKEISGACEVKEDRSNKLGGIYAESRSAKLVADDTYASRLEAQRQWFAENSGLKIV